jgi:hypothetical protein
MLVDVLENAWFLKQDLPRMPQQARRGSFPCAAQPQQNPTIHSRVPTPTACNGGRFAGTLGQENDEMQLCLDLPTPNCQTINFGLWDPGLLPLLTFLTWPSKHFIMLVGRVPAFRVSVHSVHSVFLGAEAGRPASTRLGDPCVSDLQGGSTSTAVSDHRLSPLN